MIVPTQKVPLFFDLDGTIADSASGIVASIQHAFGECGIQAPTIDWRRLIGPPLPKMLEAVQPNLSVDLRNELVAAFRRHYAGQGAFLTSTFAGISDLFEHLRALRTNVYVVTNKPQAAAESILHHLKLSDFILRVAGDDLSGTQTKPERAAKLAQEERLCGGLFIGDGLDDLRAAERINAHFLLAGWGYGTSTVLAEHPTVPTLSSPEELKRLLEQ